MGAATGRNHQRRKTQDGKFKVEFRDYALLDTAIVCIPEEGYKNEEGQIFIKIGAKVDFLKQPDMSRRAPAPRQTRQKPPRPA